MANQVEETSVTFVLENSQVVKLQNSFPEIDNIQELATTLAQLMTNEFIDLLAGEKRYLSLSHQYIEWLQIVYEAILPEDRAGTREWVRCSLPKDMCSREEEGDYGRSKGIQA